MPYILSCQYLQYFRHAATHSVLLLLVGEQIRHKLECHEATPDATIRPYPQFLITICLWQQALKYNMFEKYDIFILILDTHIKNRFG